MAEPFTSHRDAALFLLASTARLTRKAGSFLGQLVVDPAPLTPAQADWLAKLLCRADLPALIEADDGCLISAEPLADPATIGAK